MVVSTVGNVLALRHSFWCFYAQCKLTLSLQEILLSALVRRSPLRSTVHSLVVLSNEAFLTVNIIQSVTFKRQHNNNHVLRNKYEIRSRSTPCNKHSQTACDSQVKVALLASPLITPGAQKLCRSEHGVLTGTSVHISQRKNLFE
jgi:hypothetical protein